MASNLTEGTSRVDKHWRVRQASWTRLVMALLSWHHGIERIDDVSTLIRVRARVRGKNACRHVLMFLEHEKADRRWLDCSIEMR
jgi:hypothetical protein